MVDISNRAGILSGLVNRGIKNYFKDNPVKDSSVDVAKINEKLDELYILIKNLSEKPNGETIIELDTK